jgi:hypothetical protein
MSSDPTDKMSTVFQEAPSEQKDAFQRVCSAPPEQASEEDLELVAPLISRIQRLFQEGPRPTGKRVEDLDITGYLFPHNGSQGDAVKIVFMHVPGSDAVYVPLFSSIEKLKEFMTLAGIRYKAVKQINDDSIFLRELPSTLDNTTLKLIIDPHYTEEGTVRFLEIFRD